VHCSGTGAPATRSSTQSCDAIAKKAFKRAQATYHRVTPSTTRCQCAVDGRLPHLYGRLRREALTKHPHNVVPHRCKPCALHKCPHPHPHPTDSGYAVWTENTSTQPEGTACAMHRPCLRRTNQLIQRRDVGNQRRIITERYGRLLNRRLTLSVHCDGNRQVDTSARWNHARTRGVVMHLQPSGQPTKPQ
jgi:hypothetical protein